MEKLLLILLLSILLLIALLPFRSGNLLIKWLVKILLYTLSGPYYLWKWGRKSHGSKTRRRNYDLLGRYVAIFGNSSDIIKYFRNLIESGISERELKTLLDANATQLQSYRFDSPKEQMESKAQHEQNINKIAAEQQQLLVQSKLSLERIKFREQLLDQLYQRIRKKYRM